MPKKPGDLEREAWRICAKEYKGGCACEKRGAGETCLAMLGRAKQAAADAKRAEARRIAAEKAAAEQAAKLEAALAAAPEESAPDPDPLAAHLAPDEPSRPSAPPPPEAGGGGRGVFKGGGAPVEDRGPRPWKFGASPLERIRLKENDEDNARRLYAALGERLIYVQGKSWALFEEGRFSFRTSDLRAFGEGAILRRLVEAEAAAAKGRDVPEGEALERLEAELRKQRPAFATPEDAAEAVRAEHAARLLKHADKCGNVSKIEAALHSLRPAVAVDIDALDAAPEILVTPNGNLDLEAAAAAELPDPPDPVAYDGREDPAFRRDRAAWRAECAKIAGAWLRPHDRALRATKLAGAEFDPSARAPEWGRFIKFALPDPEIRAAVQRAAGALLYGRNNSQIALLLRGAGGNGKSAFTEALRVVLGEYAAPCKIELFLSQGFERAGQATPEEADLPGARAYIASEPEATDELSSKKLKAFTGGDMRPARQLNEPQFYWRPTGIPVLSFNRTPRIKGEDHGTRRRLVFLPFDQDLQALPEADRRSPEYMAQAIHRERSGILNWLLAGWRAYRAPGPGGAMRGIDPPADMLELKDALLAGSDPVGQFLADCTDRDPDGKILKQEIFRVYQEWCGRTGAALYKQRGFTDVMTEKRIREKKTDGGRWFWTGISWKPGGDMGSLLAAAGYGSSLSAAPDDPGF